MGRVIVFKREDGRISIVRPAPRFMKGFNDQSEAMACVREMAVPETALRVEEMDESELPEYDSETRSLWAMGDDGKIFIRDTE